MYVCMSVCMYMYICKYMYINTYVQIFICMYVCVYAYMYISTFQSYYKFLNFSHTHNKMSLCIQLLSNCFLFVCFFNLVPCVFMLFRKLGLIQPMFKKKKLTTQNKPKQKK